MKGMHRWLPENSSGSSRSYPAPNGAVLSNAAWDGTGHGMIVAEGEGITAVQRGASARLFRVGIMLTGARPKLSEILRQARLRQ